MLAQEYDNKSKQYKFVQVVIWAIWNRLLYCNTINNHI